MAIDLPSATKLALEAIAAADRALVDVQPVDSLPGSVYNFDPDGWLLFYIHRRNRFAVGGGEYLAVHPESGEVRSLGFIGE